MATKTISIIDDAYNLLKARKKDNESFSEVIRRIFGEKRNIMEFAGAWGRVDDEKIERIKKDILLLRKKSTHELLESVS